jgi:WhiB family redox-sensing transcriptional regulator
VITVARLVIVDVPDLSGGGCAQSDPDSWFPPPGGAGTDALRICHVCPIEAACLDYALTHDERFGIWGGMSAAQRNKLRAARKAG